MLIKVSLQRDFEALLTHIAKSKPSAAQIFEISSAESPENSNRSELNKEDANHNSQDDGNAHGVLNSIHTNIAPVTTELAVRLSPSRPSTHCIQHVLSPSIMASDIPGPQRKRRKVGSGPESLETKKQGTLPWGHSEAQQSNQDHASNTSLKAREEEVMEAKSIDLIIPPLSDIPTISEKAATPPKKVMKLRADGKLFSPPQKDAAIETSKRGRKPGPSKKQRLVTIKYGTDEISRREIGEKIGKILRGELRIRSLPPPVQQQPANSIQITTATPTKKSTHPFFLGKPKTELRELRPPSPSRSFGGTSRSSSPHKHSNEAALKPAASILFGANATKISFPPNAKEPLWPPAGLMHTRDIPSRLGHDTQITPQSFKVSNNKSKESQVLLESSEETLFLLKKTVKDPGLASQVRNDEVFYVPKRRTILRPELPSLLSKQLAGNSHQEGENGSSCRDVSSSYESYTTVAAQRLFNTLSAANSAFDSFRCENQAWTVKYSPKSSLEILQPQELVQLLEQWLSGSAVHSTTNVNNGILKQSRKAFKKRKQASELDDFIAMSDDEDSVDMSDAWSFSKPDTDRFHFDKTVPRPDKYSQLRRFTSQALGQTKAVLLSGPPGCGKTAAVYAIAQDLGFEVFEINSGSRRSGRDILEKVGDMTRNHLVSQETVHSGDDDKSADEQQSDVNNVHEEIASGKQSTMQSFFKSKPIKNTSRKASVKLAKANSLKPAPEPEKKKTSKTQKQSLILLEEVDVLFEEDKQFWSTVIALITTSKRPIIMTCNDESLIPAEELADCSLLRMSSPPESIAIDYLLLIAAHEGHLLERDAVSKLYLQNNSDLRASIMQLNLWCQMAINDPTGGLNWMLLPQDYQGTDIRTSELRVLSEGTFLPHMGFLVTNESLSATSTDRNLQRWSDAVYEWELDPEDLMAALVEPVPGSHSAATLCDQLTVSDLAYDALSAYDIQNRVFGNSQMDWNTCMSPLPDYRRNNLFTNSPSLLQVPPEETFLQTSSNISTNLSYQALSKLETNPNSLFGHKALCEKIIYRKSPLSAHHRFIEETLRVALDPMEHYGRAITSVTTDVVPYLRSIIAYDLKLKQERARLNSLMSDGSRHGKRQRTTRASRAALEGGHKSSTRRESWFEVEVDFELVLETAGQNWQAIACAEYEKAVRRWRWAQQTEQTDSEDELCR